MEWEGLKRGREQLKNTQAHTTTTLHTCSHAALDRDKTKTHRLLALRVQAQAEVQVPWLSTVHRQASSLVPIPVQVDPRRPTRCQREMEMKSQSREETTDQPCGVTKSVLSTVLP